MSSLSWIYLYLGSAILVIVCIGCVRRYFNLKHLLGQESVVLELTPPAFIRKTPEATEHFFSVLHTIGMGSSWYERLVGRHSIFSLEVVSSRSQGIRYLIRLPKARVGIFQQQIAAYAPDIRFRTVVDYIKPVFEDTQSTQIVEFKQTRHFAYPLASHNSLTQHDPVAYITGAMTKLAQDELIAFQIILSPVNSRKTTRILNKLLVGKDPGLQRRGRAIFIRFLLVVLWLPINVLRLLLAMISEFMHPTNRPFKQYHGQPSQMISASIVTSPPLTAPVHEKLAQPLFQATIRVLARAKSNQQTKQHISGIESTLASFSVPGHQGLVAKQTFGRRLTNRFRLFTFVHRVPAMLARRSCVLAVSEMAALYHFAYGDTARPENLAVSHSRTLPSPASLKHDSDTNAFDVILGENQHHGSVTDIGLTTSERERHIYIIGGTGNGKTTMLQYAIVQDMWSGKGVAVVDPHGDLAETVLRHVPEERIKDVVYFNPDDLSHPIGMNLLEVPEGLTGDDLLREKDLVTESIISIFRKLFSEDATGGHRIEYVLRNTIQTAFTIEDATLFTIFDLLNDTAYRRMIVRQLKDIDLKHFWENEIGKAGDFQRIKMVAGITAKIGRFLFSASAKRILEQPRSTIDFDDILASGKILICNFSKGLIGEDTAQLFGITILAKLQLASLRRARVQLVNRRPYYLYVDEFQNFATMPFVQMLSESRKYKLFLTMAEQSTSQQEQQRMVNVILANVGTVICFRSGNPADEQLMLPLFSPYIEPGEIVNLPTYNFYLRISAIQPKEPLSGATLLLEDAGSKQIARSVIAASRKQFATHYKPPQTTTGLVPSPALEPGVVRFRVERQTSSD